MADAGEIKAKVTIEYDGSGIQQAKEDLASLADAGGSFEKSAAGINDTLSGMGDQFAESAKGAEGLGESIGALEEPFRSGETAVSQLNDALGEHQQAIEDTGAAYEALQEPLGSTVSLLQQAPASMTQIAQRAESMVDPLSSMSDGFTQIQESLSQTVPLLPQFADSMHDVGSAFRAEDYGLNTFAENMGVFQDSLQNPYPFSAIQSHLDETGQTWDDFASSIGEDNTAMLHEMAANADGTSESLGKINKSAEATGQVFAESRGATQAFTEQFNGLNTAAEDTGKTLADTNSVVEDTGKSIAGAGKAIDEAAGGGSLGETLMGALGDVGGVLETASRFVMPLMAFQMVGMAVQQVATGIYDAAAIAEGPAAHSMGTFTGSVDALSQTTQRAGQTFSESFGKQIIPTLDAINYQMNQGGGLSQLGGFLGGTVSALTNAGMFVGGLTGIGINPMAMDMIKAGGEGLINQGAQMFGLQEPFQGPGPVTQAQINYQQQMAQLPQTIQAQTLQSQLQSSTLIAEGFNPQYLASQGQLSTAQQFLQRQQASYNAAHPVSQQSLVQGYRQQQYDQYEAQQMQNQPTYAQGIGQALSQGNFGAALGDLGAAFSSFFGGSSSTAPPSQTFGISAGGCFIAGTLVLLANGSEKPVETLQIGEKVLAHDGIDEVVTTVLARITPPPRQVYELKFSDGNTLTLTDSHPIATLLQGWKAISPEQAKQENPDLPISPLHVGDSVTTSYGACTLVVIEKKRVEQVFNITVGEPHTFYANRVLVHNKAGAMAASGTGTETISLAHTFVADVTWEANNLSKSFTAVANWASEGLSKAFTAVASWASQGLQHAFTAVASWIGQGLQHAFTAVASWIGQGLQHAFTAVASWVGQGLQHAFTAVANWIGQNLVQPFVAIAQWTGQNLIQPFVAIAQWVGQGLQHTFAGIASWIGQSLTHTFTAVASWVGQNLFHTFVGIASWIGEGLTHVFTAAASWIGVPGFAGGVENFQPWGGAAAGAALVGENGPELVMLPSGASVYPLSTGPSATPLQGAAVGSMGGGYSGPVTIQLHIGGQMLAEQTLPYLAPVIRAQFGVRR